MPNLHSFNNVLEEHDEKKLKMNGNLTGRRTTFCKLSLFSSNCISLVGEYLLQPIADRTIIRCDMKFYMTLTHLSALMLSRSIQNHDEITSIYNSTS